MSYIGQQLPADVFSGFTTDSFTGDGSATTFTLSKAPFSEDALIVVINNVIQKPVTNFTVSGTTLTIVGTAVASGDVIYAMHTSGAVPSTLASKVDVNGVSDAIILDADADTTISADTDDQIDFKTGGTDRVHINSSGNVGIGTSSIDVITQAGGSGYQVLQIENDEGGQINLDHNDAGTGSTLGMINFNRVGETVAHIGGVTDGATDSGQINFRTQPASGALTERMRITSTGTVGIGTSSPQTTLHLEATAPILRISDSNSTSEDDAVGKIQFYDRNNTDLNAEIIAGDGSLSNLILSAHNNRAVVLQTNGNTERLRATGDGKIGIGEASPDCDAGGLTLNQGANDVNILTLKSSDVAHGMTSSAETDTFGLITKADTGKGGIQIRSFAEDAASERFNINVQGDGDVTEAVSTSTRGALHFISSNKSGTGQANMNANGNILSLATYITTRFLFEADGNFHADAGSNTYDAYEDAHLARAYDLSHGKGVIESKFDKFVAYNHEKLADLKLVGREEDGTPNHFINVTGMQRLHNGAIWQQYEKHQRLAEAVYEMAKETLGKDKADAILEKHDIKLLN